MAIRSAPMSSPVDAEEDLARALPGIRDRLHERYGDDELVDRSVEAAVENTSGARVQNFRAILVERQADRRLRSARHRP
jgi:hypothetical protein